MIYCDSIPATQKMKLVLNYIFPSGMNFMSNCKKYAYGKIEGYQNRRTIKFVLSRKLLWIENIYKLN